MWCDFCCILCRCVGLFFCGVDVWSWCWYLVVCCVFCWWNVWIVLCFVWDLFWWCWGNNRWLSLWLSYGFGIGCFGCVCIWWCCRWLGRMVCSLVGWLGWVYGGFVCWFFLGCFVDNVLLFWWRFFVLDSVLVLVLLVWFCWDICNVVSWVWNCMYWILCMFLWFWLMKIILWFVCVNVDVVLYLVWVCICIWRLVFWCELLLLCFVVVCMSVCVLLCCLVWWVVCCVVCWFCEFCCVVCCLVCVVIVWVWVVFVCWMLCEIMWFVYWVCLFVLGMLVWELWSSWVCCVSG